MKSLTTSLLLTLLFSCTLFIRPTPAQSQTPSSPTLPPETAPEGYESLVPQDVQTTRKNLEFAGQLQNLRDQLNRIQGTIPSKEALQNLTKRVNEMVQYDAAIRQAILSLQTEVNRIETILDSYGQGYKAAQAAELAQQQKQQKLKPAITATI